MAEGFVHLAITGEAPLPDKPPGSPVTTSAVLPEVGHDLALSDGQKQALQGIRDAIKEVTEQNSKPIHS